MSWHPRDMETNLAPSIQLGLLSELPASESEPLGVFFLDTATNDLYVNELIGWTKVSSSSGGGTIVPTITIYLDPVAGNDANPGTIALPVKTLQRAYDLTGQAAVSTIQIVGPLLALGVLPISPIASFTLPKTSKEVILQGAPATSLDGLVHVVQSSTAYDPTTVTFVTVTPTVPPGGSVNGNFVRYLTGALAGQVFPIERLTGAALELTSRARPANGDQFVIEAPATQITWTNFWIQELEAQNFRVRNLLLSAPAGGMFAAGVGGMTFEECLLVVDGGISATNGVVLQIGTDASGQIFDTAFTTMGCFFEAGDCSGKSVLSIANTTMGGPSGVINMSQQGGADGSVLYMLGVRWAGGGSAGGGNGVAAFLGCTFQLQAVSFSCSGVVAGAKSIIQIDQGQGVMREVEVKNIPNITSNCDAINVDDGGRLKMARVIGSSGVGTPGFGLNARWGAQVSVQDPNSGTTISNSGNDVNIGALGPKTWADIALGGAANTTDAVQFLCTVH